MGKIYTRGGNHLGLKGNQGGAKARKNGISLDFSVFQEYAERLDELGADLKEIFTDVMEQEAETVQEDTIDALNPNFLPAHGVYSYGDTKDSVELSPKVQWEGSLGEVGLGFDKTKAGAGGFLVTGTPKMQPDRELERIYGKKKYETEMRKSISEYLDYAIQQIMEG